MSDRPKVVCVTQARMTSTRLPGKVLLPAAGRPLLEHHLGRLRRAALVDEVVLATTVNATDDPVAALGTALGVRVVRGPEDDVLARFVRAAEASAAEVVVRVTADCPLIDPALIDLVVRRLLETPEGDYAHLDMSQYPRGLDTEAFRRRILDEADRDPATTAAEREHVTAYIYGRPDRYRLLPVGSPHPAAPWRWCVDEVADLDLVRQILEALLPSTPQFTWRDCAALMERRPDLAAINAHIRQKGP